MAGNKRAKFPLRLVSASLCLAQSCALPHCVLACVRECRCMCAVRCRFNASVPRGKVSIGATSSVFCLSLCDGKARGTGEKLLGQQCEGVGGVGGGCGGLSVRDGQHSERDTGNEKTGFREHLSSSCWPALKTAGGGAPPPPSSLPDHPATFTHPPNTVQRGKPPNKTPEK